MAIFLRAGGGDVRTRRAPTILPPSQVARKIDAIITTRRPVSEGVVAALGDERGFVHKRIGGAIKGFISGGPIGAVGGFVSGGGPGPSLPVLRTPIARVVPTRAAAICPPGFFETPAGGCQAISAPEPRPFIDPFALPRAIGRGISQLFDGGPAAAAPGMVSEAVMGRFGAGFEPELLSTTTRRCGRGAVLGLDGICYNRRDLRNSERFWPRGRRPLLTGGEMRCISVASAAAKKLQRKQKQLTELGLLKRPPSRSKAAAPVHVRTAGVAHKRP